MLFFYEISIFCTTYIFKNTQYQFSPLPLTQHKLLLLYLIDRAVCPTSPHIEQHCFETNRACDKISLHLKNVLNILLDRELTWSSSQSTLERTDIFIPNFNWIFAPFSYISTIIPLEHFPAVSAHLMDCGNFHNLWISLFIKEGILCVS